MPEKALSRTDVLSAPTLSHYGTGTYYIKIDCAHCRVKHLYDPADLIKLCGDIQVRRIARQFRCQLCKRKDYLSSELLSPTASELAGMKVRKLIEIKLIRRPVWQDLKL
jgi:hypothetical protein